MIKKIVKIENVGKLQRLNAAGDVEFKPITLIFGPNGRGKSTLCEVLRSLQNGDTGIIQGRKTLGTGQQPSAEIRLLNATASLANAVWSETYPDVEVFDSVFVHKNVYAGDHVTHDHKKSLHRIVLGEEGVRLAEAVDVLDQQTREAESQIGQNRREIQNLIPAGVSFDQFIALQEDVNVLDAIERTQREIQATQQSRQISEKPQLSRITLPTLPAQVEELLSITTTTISEEAQRIMTEHLKLNTNAATEQWIAEGIAYIHADNCPFCAQSLGPQTPAQLIKAFREHFDNSYESLRARIVAARAEALRLGDGNVANGIRHAHEISISLFEFWQPFLADAELPAIDLTGIATDISAFSNSVVRLLDLKLRSITNAVTLDEEYSQTKTALLLRNEEIARYNEAIARINGIISATKRNTQGSNLRELENTLNRYRSVQVRYSGTAVESIQRYESSVTNKNTLVQRKNETKAELDRYSTTALSDLEIAINRYLEIFGADFRVANVQERFSGGRPSATYQLVVDGRPVELGDQANVSNLPHFGNTLSSGDRSTLALAFFLSKLMNDPRKGDKVVVLDDPFNSQDRSRKMCTQQQIRKLTQTCKQVIVLSHEPHFLKGIWDETATESRKCLQLTRLANYSTISEWNIEEHTRDEYFSQINRMKAYVHDDIGNPIDIARLVRPVLEEFLRHSYPGQFSENQWLGDYITAIRHEQYNTDHQLNALSVCLQELQDINEYSRQFHHGQDQPPENQAIDPAELASFVRRTLQLVNAY